MSNELLNWLMGVVETNPDGLDAKQVEVIRGKLEAEITSIVREKFDYERRIAEMALKKEDFMNSVGKAAVSARAVTGVNKVALGRPVSSNDILMGNEEGIFYSGTGLTAEQKVR